MFRYFTNPPSEFVLFERPSSAGGCWDKDMHNAPHKLVIRQIGHRPTASLIQSPLAVTGNIFTIQCNELKKEKIILGVLNSKFVYFFWRIMFTDFKASFPQVTIFSLSQVPINEIIFGKEGEEIVRLVDQMLDLHQRLAKIKTENERITLQRQIFSIDRQIDQMVYKIYNLNEEEIQLVEEATKDEN